MEKLPKDFRFQRILIQLTQWQLNDLRRRCIASVLRRINRRRSRFPFMILVEVTNDCTLDCIMCPHSQLREKTGYMSFDLFKRVIDECSRHHSPGDLVFSGIGEPLLHPQILEMAKFANSKGILRFALLPTLSF